jgi:hypothetical protein
MKLFNCRSESDQIAWAVEHLRKGGRIHDIGLWLGGVDRPMRIVAGVKLVLRAEGKAVVKAMEKVRDAAGDDHTVLTWRMAGADARPADSRRGTGKSPRQRLNGVVVAIKCTNPAPGPAAVGALSRSRAFFGRNPPEPLIFLCLSPLRRDNRAYRACCN